eukprot:CAMPEP_0202845600 /NCGR_PEP_ID=MMETSP1389-20130828/70413_1 /ASSEMBLY_ACC=CAM_ASM_000865 /TAXON_ID=302021 /ORGANISM="Rhodomonas sp., Strain CCMP768" /LENGTH=114 /DNA_ID=CAMNT_0049523059 /DNA_START=103 /DNA_END=444 /DNA_ORIENTATION=+
MVHPTLPPTWCPAPAPKGRDAEGELPPRSGGARSTQEPRRVELRVGLDLGELSVKKFDELHVGAAGLGAGEAAVLLEDGGHRPVVHGPEAPHQAASAVLSLIAVDEDRVHIHIE